MAAVVALDRRRYRLVVAAALAANYRDLSAKIVEIDALRVQFKVERNLAKEPNTAEIQVSNLSAASRAELQDKGVKVVLEAGDVDTVATIFHGDAAVADHKRDGSQWVTTLQCGDGERAYKFARSSASFRAGTPVPAVIRSLADAMGLGVGNLEQQAAAIPSQYASGRAVHGRAAAELDRVLRDIGYEWSVQDGQLQILRVGDHTVETAVVLKAGTGLVGSPEMGTPEKKGGKAVLKARALLQPLLRPGALVDLESDQFRGLFRVEKVTHTGDSHGNDWYSDVELRAK